MKRVRSQGRMSNALQFFQDNLGITGSRSYLRSDASLQNGATANINFQLLNNQGSMLPQERRLGSADAFVATAVGVYIYKAGTSTSATDAQKAGARLHTFNNVKIFTTAAETLALETLYNGFLSIAVQRVNWFPYIAMRKFFRAGTAQDGTLVFTASNTAASTWEGPDYGLMPLTPTVCFSGQGQNDVSVTLPVSVDMAGTSSTNGICFWADGILLPNAAGRVSRDMMNAFNSQFGG